MNNLYFCKHPYQSYRRRDSKPVKLSMMQQRQHAVLSIFLIIVILGIPTILKTAGADSRGSSLFGPALTSVTSSSTSFLVSPVCNHTSLSDPTVCYGDSA